MNVKKGLFLVCIGFVMLTLFANIGLSWQSGYDNRVSINYSSDFMNDTAISLKFNVSIGCVDTVYCNDSAVNFLWSNGTEELIPYYFENITNLWIKVPQLNNTNNSIDVYFNASNITQNSYYNGSKTFIKFADFENETGFITSFGALAGGTPRTNTTEYYKGIQSLSLTDDEPRPISSFGALTTSAFVEMYYKCSVTDTKEFYFGSGTTVSWGSTLSYLESIAIKNVWTKIRIELNGSSATGNLTQLGTVYKMNLGTPGTVGQFAFPGIYSQGSQICYIDEWYYGKYYPEDRVYYSVGNFESNVTTPTDYLNLTYLSPDILNETANHSITFAVIPAASSDYINCSLRINSTIYANESAIINNSAVSWIINLANGTYDFNMSCYTSTLFNSTDNYELNVMVAYPIMPSGNISTIPAPFGNVVSICTSNMTLKQIWNESIIQNGIESNITRIAYSTCPYGCSNDICNKSAWDNTIYALEIFAGVLVILLLIFMVARQF